MGLFYRESFRIHIQNSYSLSHIAYLFWYNHCPDFTAARVLHSVWSSAISARYCSCASRIRAGKAHRHSQPKSYNLVSTGAWRLAPSLFPRRCCHLFPTPLAKPWLSTALGSPLDAAGAAAAHHILLAHPERGGFAQCCNFLSGAKGTQEDTHCSFNYRGAYVMGSTPQRDAFSSQREQLCHCQQGLSLLCLPGDATSPAGKSWHGR